MTIKRFQLFAALLLLAFAVSCGSKAPPSPQVSEDVFVLTKAQGNISSGCIVVEATVEGNRAMLDHFSLQIEDMTLDCPQCPFAPQHRVELGLEDQRVRFKGDRVQIIHCDISGARSYRFRLLGHNRIRSMAPAQTPVLPRPENPRLTQE